MTRASENSIDPSSLPGDPAAYRRHGPGPAFWVAIGFGLFCVVAAVFVWLAMPALFPRDPAAPVDTRPLPLTAPQSPPPAPAPAAVLVNPSVGPSAAAPTDVAALAARLERVEIEQRRASEAAARALAAASLAEAAQGSAPFAQELAALGGLLPASGDVRALQAVAVVGAPTRAALAAEFPQVAAKAAVAARAPASGDGVMARASHALAAIFTIRRVDHTSGTGPDGALARAEALIREGDLSAAFAELDRLPEGAREALAPWRTKAQRRLEIDRHVSAIRAAALRDLSLSTGRTL